MSAYDYVVNHCKGQENPKRIVFQDDDSFLVVDKVTKMMQNTTLAPITCLAGFSKLLNRISDGGLQPEMNWKTLRCFSDDESRPFRFGKYNLTFTEWETGYWFPSFCAGPCTGMARSTVETIYNTGKVHQSSR